MIGLGSLFLFVCYVVSMNDDRFVVHCTIITQIYDRNCSNPNYSLFYNLVVPLLFSDNS